MNVLLLMLNALLIYGSFLLSFLIRYGTHIPHESFLPFRGSWFFLLGIMIASLSYAGVFRRRFRSYWQHFQILTLGLAIGTVLCFVFMYLLRDKWARFPSSVFLINFLLCAVGLFVLNSLILRFMGKIQKRIVVLGNSPFYDPFQKKDTLVHKKNITTIEELMDCHDMDEVMICQRIHDNPNLNLLVFLLLKLNVVVTFSPAIYAELISGRIEKSAFLNLFSTFVGRKSDLEEGTIRFLDVMVSLGLLVSFSPLLIIISILIKRTSPGPVIYRQQRVGKDRKLFTLYKFRTMYINDEHRDGYKPAVLEDKRITSIGHFLRNTRLDELPQLVNVLKGQMSMVGPRPENVTRVNTHKALRGLRLAVKPGLTGLAQIRSYYDLSPGHKIKYDYLYIQRRSLMLNLYILYKTIFVVLGRKGQ